MVAPTAINAGIAQYSSGDCERSAMSSNHERIGSGRSSPQSDVTGLKPLGSGFGSGQLIAELIAIRPVCWPKLLIWGGSLRLPVALGRTPVAYEGASGANLRL